jgi:hypothetical protein
MRVTLSALLALAFSATAAMGQAANGERVLSPDHTTVVYVRSSSAGDGATCPAPPHADEIWQSRIDGSAAHVLVRGRTGSGPQDQLCGFYALQFSSDGKRLLFISEAWATSGALHEYDFTTGKERFVMPANDVVVLNFCDGENRDRLIVDQHRYYEFVLGSFDWYWLYSADGRTEIGAVGEINDRNALIAAARDDYRCRK